MGERFRSILGFLGLVDDGYGDYGPPTLNSRGYADGDYDGAPEPARARSSRPRTERPLAPRPVPITPQSSAPRPGRPTITGRDSGSMAQRPRPKTPANTARVNEGRQPLTPSPVSGASHGEVAYLSPHSIDELRELAGLIREGRMVVLSTSGVKDETARRIVDFMAGTVWALGAKAQGLLKTLYAIAPAGTEFSEEMKDRLRQTHR